MTAFLGIKHSGDTDVSKTKDILTTVGTVAPGIAIYLYFLGISYLYGLSYYLGFSLSSIDVPINYIFAYSYGTFLHVSWWNAGLWAAFAVGLGTLLFADRTKPWTAPLLLAVILALFPLSSHAANSYAHEEARNITWSPRRLVNCTFKKDSPPPSGFEDAIKRHSGQGLILVLETSQMLVAMDRRAKSPDDLAINTLYVIPMSSLSSIDIIFTEIP